MKLVIIAQEEPIYVGPFLMRFLEENKDRISLVALSSLRGGLFKPKGLKEYIKRIYVYWLIFEPKGFFKALWRRIIWFSFRNLPLLDNHDFYSIRRAALKLNIPIIAINDPNDKDFLCRIRKAEPDIIFNQSEFRLSKELLDIPKLGVINRHGSLLPKYRGRMASFWSHFDGKVYGHTIHFINEHIDAGEIIVQRKYKIKNTLPLFDVMGRIFRESYNDTISALKIVKSKNYKSIKNLWKNKRIYKFPSIKDAIEYRKVLNKRRENEIFNKK